MQNLGQIFPVGSVIMWAGSDGQIPDGWLWCDGSTYDPVQFPALFAAIDNIYGTTAGFPNLPDYRGVVPVGVIGGLNPIGSRTTGNIPGFGLSSGGFSGGFSGGGSGSGSLNIGTDIASAGGTGDFSVDCSVSVGVSGSVSGGLMGTSDAQTFTYAMSDPGGFTLPAIATNFIIKAV